MWSVPLKYALLNTIVVVKVWNIPLFSAEHHCGNRSGIDVVIADFKLITLVLVNHLPNVKFGSMLPKSLTHFILEITYLPHARHNSHLKRSRLQIQTSTLRQESKHLFRRDDIDTYFVP